MIRRGLDNMRGQNRVDVFGQVLPFQVSSNGVTNGGNHFWSMR